ncbi:MAG: hypothetical protein FVQ82_03765 [Planctomycetes bacterium]|nr:hypothetical protein [Planctomycetota bacterium]
MNGRSPLVTFFLFVFIAVLIGLQFLSMIQSDRLYERLNDVIRVVENTGFSGSGSQTAKTSGDKYPGDVGDWLIWRLEGEPSTLTYVHTGSDAYTSYIVSGTIFESLLKYDIDKYINVPQLAESYEVSEDKLTVTYKIKEEACFSDGHPVTADDVVFSYDMVMDPLTDTASHASYFSIIKDVVKVDDKTVKFLFDEVQFKAVDYSGMMEIYPEHIYKYDDPKDFNDRISDPVGSGPYVFEKWNVGSDVVLKRNENYWGKKPNIVKIIYKFINNNTAAVQALRAHKVDFMRPLPEQYHELSQDEEFKKDFQCLSYWDPGVGYFWIGWNQDRVFFKDKRVRLALTHLIDRQLILDKLLKIPEAVMPTGPFYIFGPQNDASIKPWPYDPEKAKKLLDEAGWIDTDGDGVRDKDGVPFRFKYTIVAGFKPHTQMAKLVKDSLASVGIDVTPDPYEGSIFFNRVKDRQFDAVNMAWGGGLAADPYQVWHSSQIGKRGSNYVGFNIPEADKLIEDARKEFDADKRNAMYKKFHRIVHEQQPYTFIYSKPQQRFLDKRFENVKIHTLGLDQLEWYVPRQLQKYN